MVSGSCMHPRLALVAVENDHATDLFVRDRHGPGQTHIRT